MIKKDTFIHSYIHPFISPSGVVYMKCDGCKVMKRASLLESIKVKIGYGRVWLDGVHVKKGGGRITYTEGRWQNFPKFERQLLCFACRNGFAVKGK